MKKGFTLIELLATIIILGLVIAISYPKILEMLEKKEKELDSEKVQLLNNAADQYMGENLNTYPPTLGTTYCFSIDTLDSENLIPFELEDYKNKNIKVKIGKNNNSYTIVDSCE